MAKFEFPKEIFKVSGFMKSIATNKYVLYIVAFFALTNILGYIMMNKNICVLLFILIAYAMTYFTKNMVFVLLVPIFVVGFFAICKETTEVIERFTNKDAGMKEGDSVISMTGDMSGVIEKMEDGEVTIRISPAEGDTQSEEETMTMSESEFKKNWKSAKEGMDPEMDFLEEEEEYLAEEGELLNDEEMDLLDEEEDEIEYDETEGFRPKKKVKKMKKAKVKGAPLPSTTGGINKKKTKISAMTTMEDGLGEQGMAGLAGDTQKLMKNQEALMDAMKNMGPMLQQAKGMLDSLDIGGLGTAISAITGGKGGAKENFSGMTKWEPLSYSAYPN